MPKQNLEITRNYAPQIHEISFSISNNHRTILIDSSFAPDSSHDPHDSDAIAFTHGHPDHMPTMKLKKPYTGVAYVSQETDAVAPFLNPHYHHNFPNRVILSRKTPTNIKKFGELHAIPVSHNGITHAFRIETNPDSDNNTIVVATGDLGSGHLTDLAAQKLSTLPPANLLIADAKGFKKPSTNISISQEEQQRRIRLGFDLADQQRIASQILLKPGDLYPIADMAKSGTLNDRQILTAPRLTQILHAVGWNKRIQDELGLTLHPQENKTLTTGQVLITDDGFDKSQSQEHILINVSNNKNPHYQTNLTLAVIPAGQRGHADTAFIQLLQATRTPLVTYTHPPDDFRKFNESLGDTKLVITKKGQSIILGD